MPQKGLAITAGSPRARALGPADRGWAVAVLIAALAAATPMAPPVAPPGESVHPAAVAPAPAPATAAKADEMLAKLPLRFEPNAGQVDPAVSFVARHGDATVFFTASGGMVTVHSKKPGSTTGDVLRMSLAGANPAPRVEGMDALPGITNYLVGKDAATWHRDIPGYAGIAYRNVYPGVDLVYRGSGGNVEYDFQIAPGADPSAISLSYDGGAGPRLDGGDLVAGSGATEVRQHPPAIFQDVNGTRRSVSGGFDLQGGRVGFHLGRYDRRQPLVIDPVVQWSFWPAQGGNQSGLTNPASLALDPADNVYVAGVTSSPEFPTTPANTFFTDGSTTADSSTLTSASAAFTTADVGEAVVGTDDPTPILINTTITAVVNATTVTLSTNASLTKSPVGFVLGRPYKSFTDGVTNGTTTFTSASAAFTASDVGKPIASSDLASGTTIAAVVNATTVTLSKAAPSSKTAVGFTVARALRITQGGLAVETSTIFVFKLNAAGTALMYSTYLGGSEGEGSENLVGIAVDSAGDAYVSTDTSSADYPTTANAFSRSCGADGLCNAVAFAGTRGHATAGSPYYTPQCDPCGNLVGEPISGTFIQPGTTIVGLQTKRSNIAYDVFTLSKPATGTGTNLAFTVMLPSPVAVMSKLDRYGSSLLYSTFLGGGNLASHAPYMALGGTDSVYVAGDTRSFDFPVTAGAFQPRCGSDGYCGAVRTGGSTTAGSTTYTSPNAAFNTGDVGLELWGPDIPAGTTVVAVTNATTATLSRAATSSGTGLSFAKGQEAHTGVFVARFNTAASGAASLAYSTYLGTGLGRGGYGDHAAGVAADGGGGAYVIGATAATDFPTTPSAYQPHAVAAPSHSFLSRIDTTVTMASAAPSSLVYSTYVTGTGGGFADATSLVVDASGNAWVGGDNAPADLPTTAGAYQTTCSGGGCAFVEKLNTGASGASSLVFSTFLGGSGSGVTSLAVDNASPPNVTVVGVGGSPFPQIQPIAGGGSCSGCSIIAQFNGSGSSLVYSSYLDRRGIHGVVLDSAQHPVFTAQGPPASVTKLDPTQNAGAYITGVAPPAGPIAGGAKVVITGGQLTGATFVYFGNVAAPSFSVDSDSQITAISPACAPQCDTVAGRTVALRVLTASHGASLPATPAAYYYEGPPILSGLTPIMGPATGGTSVVVSGVGFTETASVSFGAVAVTAHPCPPTPVSPCFTVNSDGQLTAITPAQPKGTVDVAVTGGGFNEGTTATAPADRFSYTTGGWSLGAIEPTALRHQTATVLDGPVCRSATPAAYCGRVLIAGGIDADGNGSHVANAAWLYDPESGSWSAAADMKPDPFSVAHDPTWTGRSQHTATLLDGPECHNERHDWCGKVLVVGGRPMENNSNFDVNFLGLTTAELYDPASGPAGSWTLITDPLPGMGVLDNTATLIGGSACAPSCGQVLIVGGTPTAYGHPPSSTVTLFDPAHLDHPWSSCSSATARPGCPAPLSVGRSLHTATSLADGTVLVSGGLGLSPGSALIDGGLKITGSLSPTTAVERYHPAGGNWTTEGPLPVAVFETTATLLGGHRCEAAVHPSYCGKVLLAGGTAAFDDDPNYYPQTPCDQVLRFSGVAELYDPQSGVWTATGTMREARGGHSATLLPSGEVLTDGSGTRDDCFGFRSSATAELYNPETGRWAYTDSLHDGHTSATASLLWKPSCAGAAPSDFCGRVLATGRAGDAFGLGSGTLPSELYAPAPAIDALSPPSGSSGGGASVVITGSGFTTRSTVSFGGVPASAHLDSPYQITASSPSHSGPGDVEVVVTNPLPAGDSTAMEQNPSSVYSYDGCTPAASPGQLLYPRGYSLIGVPDGTSVPSQSFLYGWFDQGSGTTYSAQDPSITTTRGGHGYWAWLGCSRAVTLSAPGSSQVSMPLQAGHASMVGNPSSSAPATVTGQDFAARWDPNLNGGAGGYTISRYREAQQLAVGAGAWVFSYRATTVSVAAGRPR